eukprot:1899503-Amphidinium_carterae.1
MRSKAGQNTIQHGTNREREESGVNALKQLQCWETLYPAQIGNPSANNLAECERFVSALFGLDVHDGIVSEVYWIVLTGWSVR